MAAITVIYSASDDYSGDYLTAQAIPQKYTSHIGGHVVIGKHVIIGTNSTVIGPCNIGEGCSIGSMSFIQKELEPWGIYAGIPCRRIKERKKGLLEIEKIFLLEESQKDI
jgi:acetyltransferase-like isoleucine patch superfamily enzyme